MLFPPRPLVTSCPHRAWAEGAGLQGSIYHREQRLGLQDPEMETGVPVLTEQALAQGTWTKGGDKVQGRGTLKNSDSLRRYGRRCSARPQEKTRRRFSRRDAGNARVGRKTGSSSRGDAGG